MTRYDRMSRAAEALHTRSQTRAGIHLKHDDELLSALHTQGLLIILDLNLTRERNVQVIHVNRYFY